MPCASNRVLLSSRSNSAREEMATVSRPAGVSNMAALCPETVAATATARPERPRWKAAAFTGIIGPPFPPAPPVHDDPENLHGLPHPQRQVRLPQRHRAGLAGRLGARSEARRVGNECVSRWRVRWSPY